MVFCMSDAPAFCDAMGNCYSADALVDRSDLFAFCCELVVDGTKAANWWEGYPRSKLPNGGRQARTPQEAEKHLRHTRTLAIAAGVWPAL